MYMEMYLMILANAAANLSNPAKQIYSGLDHKCFQRYE